MNTYHHSSVRSVLGITLGIAVTYLGSATTAFALIRSEASYVPIVGIPGVSAGSSLPEYINNVYIVAVGVGALFAVVKIALAGVKYSTSGVVTDKSDAKKDIQGVLLGLAILLLPALVLGTINPQLLNLDVLSRAGKIDLRDTSGNAVGQQMNTSSSVAPGKTITETNPEAVRQVQATKTPVGCLGKDFCSTSGSCYSNWGSAATWVPKDPTDVTGTSGGTCYK